jgi:hypothetical protein
MECRSCFVCAMNCSGGSGWSCIYTRPVWAARDNCCATRMDPHATADANTSISYRGSADALGKEHAHSVTARIYQCDIDMRPLRCPRAERTSRKALAREQAGRCNGGGRSRKFPAFSSVSTPPRTLPEKKNRKQPEFSPNAVIGPIYIGRHGRMTDLVDVKGPCLDQARFHYPQG